MKTALITGANKSIGFEVAKQLAQKEHYVYLGSRDLQKGEEAVAKLKALGLNNLEAIQLDVTAQDSVSSAATTLGQKINSLDVLINNAGISGGFPQSPTEIDTGVIREVFETNFFGPIEMIKKFLDLLKKSASPRIVNVTSGLGSLTLHSDPSWKYYAVKGAAYGPSKTALNAYTLVLAHALKETSFKINVIDPGYTATDFNQHRGPGNVEDAARFVVKYALLGNDGPTGRFFSHDFEGKDNESPW
ncbi:SDR family oxidoreductase [Chryseolinea soli]|uniref:SDR family oxidoreductase n=1 Tax=Chryseolinea soli TaxID=2321403 RepID=A0A385SQ36_9BACT|nr:SDR family oxidoreductase [Chryseolinea soli]AYB32075.1 SDR family oxidoreductase [Chryseolinea soli]